MSKNFTHLLAVIAMLAGLGCSGGSNLPTDGSSGSDAATDIPVGGVTYWRDIRAILESNCTGCHRMGGIGPFGLESYDDARAVAAVMSGVTAARRMPPWPPSAEGCRTLQNARVLTQAQIDAIAAWVRDGTPEGNRADYVAPMARMDPFPPQGDLVVQPPDPYTPNPAGSRVDDYHCFVLDPQLTTTRDVIGFRVTPGNGSIVHHMLLFEVRAAAIPAMQRNDDAEPGPGYTCFGGPNVPTNFRFAPAGSPEPVLFDSQQVGAWAPGSPAIALPATTGIRLAAGSRLVMQVHYNLSAPGARGMTDRTRVDLYLSPQPVISQAVWLPHAQTRFTVPAGAGADDPRATVTATPYDWRLPVRIWGVAPHMHQRGRSIRVGMTLPDGTTSCLVNIPNWDFHWQQSYFFTSPQRTMTNGMGVSTRTSLTCVYDNSAANQPIIDGMQQPPRDLHWGEGTDDEMCLNYYYVTL